MLFPKKIQCPECKQIRMVDYRLAWEHKKKQILGRCLKCSRFKKGQTNSGGFKKGSIPWNKGTNKGSISTILKDDKRWAEWRKAVFERDKYRCMHCGKVGGKLEPHHLWPASVFPEFAYILSNGKTLCHSCHKKTDSYGYKAKYFIQKFLEREKLAQEQAELYEFQLSQI
jgi:hypothetical protein